MRALVVVEQVCEIAAFAKRLEPGAKAETSSSLFELQVVGRVREREREKKFVKQVTRSAERLI